MHLLNLVLWALLPLLLPSPTPSKSITSENIPSVNVAENLYQSLKLEGKLDYAAFSKALEGVEKYHPNRQFVAIADFSKPSDQKRLFIVDLEQKRVVMNTYVAHGKNSGSLMATTFSNVPQSFMSSPGFYMVNNIITSPKHGQALLLEGLEKGINDNARKREIIIHGAAYVCESFIKAHGRIGRSYGCPAVPVDEMAQVSQYLAGGSLLFIYSPTYKG